MTKRYLSDSKVQRETEKEIIENLKKELKGKTSYARAEFLSLVKKGEL